MQPRSRRPSTVEQALRAPAGIVIQFWTRSQPEHSSVIQLWTRGWAPLWRMLLVLPRHPPMCRRSPTTVPLLRARHGQIQGPVPRALLQAAIPRAPRGVFLPFPTQRHRRMIPIQSRGQGSTFLVPAVLRLFSAQEVDSLKPSTLARPLIVLLSQPCQLPLVLMPPQVLIPEPGLLSPSVGQSGSIHGQTR